MILGCKCEDSNLFLVQLSEYFMYVVNCDKIFSRKEQDVMLQLIIGGGFLFYSFFLGRGGCMGRWQASSKSFRKLDSTRITI